MQALYNLRNSSIPEGPRRNWVHIWSNARVQKTVHFKSEVQRTATWSAPPWPPCHLCCRPTVFFRHHHRIAHSRPQQKRNIRRAFQSSCYFTLSTTLKTPVSRKSPKSVRSLYFQTTRNLYGTDLPCFKWLFSLTLRLFCCRISWCGGRYRLFGRRCFSVSWSGGFSRRLK